MEYNSENENLEYIDIQKLSRYLGIKVSTLYCLAAERKIPHYRVGRLLRFKKSEIDQWMEIQKKECIDVSKEARKIMKPVRGPVRDINKLVKKVIDQAKGVDYTVHHGKPDQVKGLGKEVPDGTL